MDLLIEKGDKRTYLSRYKVITTSFEESAPSVKRNNTQIQYRNGNVDFGGWHETKTIDYVGYYRADDLEDEEYLRERIYALLSDPDGYYITQLKNDNDDSFERPGETSGDYFDKQVNRPSHKRFYVYASSLESELVGSYGGHVLYKISATFATMKLPYGESVPHDLDVKSKMQVDNSAVGANYLRDSDKSTSGWAQDLGTMPNEVLNSLAGKTITISVDTEWSDFQSTSDKQNRLGFEMAVSGSDGKTYWFGTWKYPETPSGKERVSTTLTLPANVTFTVANNGLNGYVGINGTGRVSHAKIEKGSLATDWCPNPSDPGYNKWYLDTYYNTDNLVIPYAGTVPCNQLEQGFAIEFTAKEAGSRLVIDLNGTELTYNGQVYNGDVFKISGYEYLRNGISIVKSTNKAYFKLLPGIANKISSSLAGEIRILDYQDLYA